MQVYNVEVFHRDFSFVHNYTVEDITYKYDYLTPVENEVMMSYNANVKMGDYIVIRSDERYYDGVISGIEVLTTDFMKVKYKPLLDVFNTSVFIDWRNQDPAYGGTSQKSIEQVIYENIKYIFIDGYPPLPWELESYYGFSFDIDDLQKIPGLVLTKKTDTMVWQLGLEMPSSIGEYNYFCEVNLVDYVIPRALKSVGVMVSMRLDVENKKIYCDIEKTASTSLTIEADLPQILKKNINVVNTMEMPNKAIYLPSLEPYAQVTTYYRHSNGKWDTNNTDRLTPVILYSETPLTTEYPTLEAELFDKYGAVLYANLIELTTAYGAYEIEIGNTASIISEDNQYESMLTGYEIHGDIIKYIFGMIRLDLTKILKRRL